MSQIYHIKILQIKPSHTFKAWHMKDDTVIVTGTRLKFWLRKKTSGRSIIASENLRVFIDIPTEKKAETISNNSLQCHNEIPSEMLCHNKAKWPQEVRANL